MDPPAGGDSRRLCAAFGAPGRESAVEKVLKAPGDHYVFAHERHAALVEALGLPGFAAAAKSVPGTDF